MSLSPQVSVSPLEVTPLNMFLCSFQKMFVHVRIYISTNIISPCPPSLEQTNTFSIPYLSEGDREIFKGNGSTFIDQAMKDESGAERLTVS